MKRLWLFLLILYSATPTLAQTNTSAYTDLGRKFCRTLKSVDNEMGEYLGSCPGLGAYKLLLEQENSYQYLKVITPKGDEFSISPWTVVSDGVSSASLGQKAEWRQKTIGRSSTQVALIVRYNFEETGSPYKKTSFLVVIKITQKEICVTDKIHSGPNANDEARRLADESAVKSCLKAK